MLKLSACALFFFEFVALVVPKDSTSCVCNCVTCWSLRSGRCLSPSNDRGPGSVHSRGCCSGHTVSHSSTFICAHGQPSFVRLRSEAMISGFCFL